MKKDVGLIGGIVVLLFSTAHAVETIKPETNPATAWSREGKFLIDTNVVNLNSQHEAAVAFDGTNYLVVWEDDRSGDWDIYGARVDQAGNVIDPVAIPISTAPNDQRNPAICFCGADYLVVWEDTRNDSLGDIYGARVNQAGVVLDPAGIAITTADSTQKDPSLAFDGTNYLATWCTLEYDFMFDNIYGARVNQNGIVLDTTAFRISFPGGGIGEGSPAVAYDGVNYLVVFHWGTPAPGSHPAISGRFVTPAGDTLPGTIGVAGGGYGCLQPSIAFDGTNYLVTFIGRRAPGIWNVVCGARVDQAGNVLDTITIEEDVGKNWLPSVAFDGLNYCVVWQDSCSDSTSWDICGAALNTSGIVIESFDVSIQSGSQITPALTHGTGDQILITYSGWTDSINGNPVNRMRIWGKFYPFIGVEEGEASIVKQNNLGATIFSGPLLLPEGKECKVFDITGRVVEPTKITRGIYFIEVDGIVTQKVVKIR